MRLVDGFYYFDEFKTIKSQPHLLPPASPPHSISTRTQPKETSSKGRTSIPFFSSHFQTCGWWTALNAGVWVLRKFLNSFIFPWQLNTVGRYVNLVVDKAMLATSNMAARVGRWTLAAHASERRRRCEYHCVYQSVLRGLSRTNRVEGCGIRKDLREQRLRFERVAERDHLRRSTGEMEDS